MKTAYDILKDLEQTDELEKEFILSDMLLMLEIHAPDLHKEAVRGIGRRLRQRGVEVTGYGERIKGNAQHAKTQAEGTRYAYF